MAPDHWSVLVMVGAAAADGMVLADTNHGSSPVRPRVSVIALIVVGAVVVTAIVNGSALVLSEFVVAVFGVSSVCGVSANAAAGVAFICHGVKSDVGASLSVLLSVAVV